MENAREEGTCEKLSIDDELKLTRTVAHLTWSLQTLLREATVLRPTSFGSSTYGPFGNLTGPLHQAMERAHHHRDKIAEIRREAS